MMLNVNMLGASVVLWVVGESNAALVICENRDGREFLELAIQNLTEEKAKPDSFLGSLSNRHILSFGG
jgi:hypothetical protein